MIARLDDKYDISFWLPLPLPDRIQNLYRLRLEHMATNLRHFLPHNGFSEDIVRVTAQSALHWQPTRVTRRSDHPN